MGTMRDTVDKALAAARETTDIGRTRKIRDVVVKSREPEIIDYILTLLETQETILKRLASEIDRLRAGQPGKEK